MQYIIYAFKWDIAPKASAEMDFNLSLMWLIY